MDVDVRDLKNIFIQDEQRRRQEEREEEERIEGQRRQAEVIPLNILMLIQREVYNNNIAVRLTKKNDFTLNRRRNDNRERPGS